MEIREFLPKRFDRLNEQLQDNEAVLIFANNEPVGVNRFSQDKNFLYFTGLEIPNAKLLVAKSNGKISIKLFIERNIPERIVWEGAKMYPEEATEISAIENVKFLDEFNHEFSTSMAMFAIKKLYVNYGNLGIDKVLNDRLIFVRDLRDRNPQVVISEITEVVRPLRQYKDEFEIEQLQKAIDITGQGLDVIFKNSKAGMFEFQLESMLYNEMLSEGFRHWGFTPIIASAKNAATLHYIENEMQIADNCMVLCDVGAECYGYSADVTRTFPIGETFEPRCKEVYSEVLATQKELIEMIKPGISFIDLNKKAVELITKSCHKLGLIKEDSEVRKYYMHSIGHHLGLDTHDVGTRTSVLEPGMVITIEPGIYIDEESIGVRIEDDVLVTEDGFRVLSSNIPKEVEDLEKIRKETLS